MDIAVVAEAPGRAMIVSSNGRFVLTEAATRESLATYIVQHQETAHGRKQDLFYGGLVFWAFVVGYLVARALMKRAYKGVQA